VLKLSSADAVQACRDTEPFTLYLGDCKTLLSDMPADSVDLIISSPPYFIGKEYDRSSRSADFESEHKQLAPLLSRVLRPGGSLCWQTGAHVSNGAVIPLDYIVYGAFSCQPGMVLRNRIVWHFEHGVHARKRFSGRHETVLWFTKGEDYTFNLDSVRGPQKYPGKRHYKGPKKGEYS
jgi:adenine-specific DNA-methyltransferase